MLSKPAAAMKKMFFREAIALAVREEMRDNYYCSSGWEWGQLSGLVFLDVVWDWSDSELAGEVVDLVDGCVCGAANSLRWLFG